MAADISDNHSSCTLCTLYHICILEYAHNTIIIHTASTCTNAIKQKRQVWGVSKGADIQSLDEAALLEGRHTCVTSPHPWIPGHVDKGKYGTGGEICQD